jgi:hypothetical protein
MLGTVHNNQILDPVIVGVTVEMVNVLAPCKPSSEVGFHHLPVLVDEVTRFKVVEIPVAVGIPCVGETGTITSHVEFLSVCVKRGRPTRPRFHVTIGRTNCFSRGGTT